MLYAFNEAHRKGKTVFRIVLKLPEERVVGLHMLGPGVDEILQGFAVAIGMARRPGLDLPSRRLCASPALCSC
eukprot:SAG11_NODE_116_length_16002_cov_19.164560_11_plen_73_part_00